MSSRGEVHATGLPWLFLLERHHGEFRDDVRLKFYVQNQTAGRHMVHILPHAMIPDRRHRLEKHFSVHALDHLHNAAVVIANVSTAPRTAFTAAKS
jgi:hypothetical protein